MINIKYLNSIQEVGSAQCSRMWRLTVTIVASPPVLSHPASSPLLYTLSAVSAHHVLSAALAVMQEEEEG